MDKYEEMMKLFYRDGKWKDWNPFIVKKLLMWLDGEGQLLEKRTDGELDAFVAWMMCDDEQLNRLKEGMFPTKNGGEHKAPVFFASKNKKATFSILREIKPYWSPWSWRRGRFKEVS